MTENFKTNNETNNDVILMIYTGEHEGQTRKTIYGFLEVDPKTQFPINFGAEFFSAHKARGGQPGALFEVKVAKRTEDGALQSLYLQNATLVGFCHHPDMKQMITDWQMRTRAHKEAKVALKRANQDLIADQPEPLKQEYINLSPAKRKAFLAYMITYIMR